MKSTYMAKRSEIPSRWFVIDATDVVLGRLASYVAHRLRGKHLPEYTPNQMTGDTIVVINADKIRVTGKKAQQKKYYWHTGMRLKERNLQDQMDRNPAVVIEKAIKGMLPNTVLGRQAYRRLKVYAGAEHPHEAQKPAELSIKE